MLWPLLTTDSIPLSSTLSSAPTNTPAVEGEAFLEDTKRNESATPPSVGTKGNKCQSKQTLRMNERKDDM